MKIRKIILTVTVMLCARMFGQGYPVFDNLGWLSGIDRFYQGYDQIMNTIKQIEQNYQQIEHAIKEAKSWSFEDLDFNDGNFLVNIDIRDEVADATKQVNRQLNNIRQIKETFEKENMTIGNVSFSMKDLAGLGDKDKTMDQIIKEAISTEISDFKEGFKQIAQGVSEKDAKVIYAKYGLSPKNFLMVKAVDKKMQEVSSSVLAGVSDKVKEMQYESAAAQANPIIAKIMADPENLTEKEIQQANALLGKLQGDLLVELQNAINQCGAYQAWKDVREKAEKEALAEDDRIMKDIVTKKGKGYEDF